MASDQRARSAGPNEARPEEFVLGSADGRGSRSVYVHKLAAEHALRPNALGECTQKWTSPGSIVRSPGHRLGLALLPE